MMYYTVLCILFTWHLFHTTEDFCVHTESYIVSGCCVSINLAQHATQPTTRMSFQSWYVLCIHHLYLVFWTPRSKKCVIFPQVGLMLYCANRALGTFRAIRIRKISTYNVTHTDIINPVITTNIRLTSRECSRNLSISKTYLISESIWNGNAYADRKSSQSLLLHVLVDLNVILNCWVLMDNVWEGNILGS